MKPCDAVEVDLTAILEIYKSTVPTRVATADTEPISVGSRLAWFREHETRRGTQSGLRKTEERSPACYP